MYTQVYLLYRTYTYKLHSLDEDICYTCIYVVHLLPPMGTSGVVLNTFGV